MNTRHYSLIVFGILALAALACGLPAGGSAGGGPVTIQGTIPPIDASKGPGGIDVCGAIPDTVIESARGKTLLSKKSFDYYGTTGSSGCWYDFGKSSSNEAFFGYVALTPVSAYADQPLYQNKDVSGIGDAAYFNNGADARQLWVKIDDKLAFVVAFGDVPQEEAAQAVAKLVAAAIQK